MQTNEEYLEITTAIGCPVMCLEFCPQEVLIKNYHGKTRMLTLENFKTALSHVPEGLPICFSGFSEPFAAKDTLKMIKYAYELGHPILMFTTLFGLTKSEVNELVSLRYLEFRLHLPDGKIMKVPLTDDYKDNVFTVIQNVPNLTFSLMNNKFQSNYRERAVRGSFLSSKKKGYCYKHTTPQFVMLPNGDVQICCTDFGLWHKIGNLYSDNYMEIRKNYMGKHFRLCSTCRNNMPISTHVAAVLLKRILRLGGWSSRDLAAMYEHMARG